MSKKRDLSKLPEYLLGNASAMADTAETCNKIVSTVNSLVPGFAATGVAAAMSSPVVAGLVFVTMTSLNLWGQWREAKDESKREAVVARLLQAVSDPYQTAAKLARERGLDQLPAIVDEPNNWMLVLDALISEQGRQVREQLEKNLAPILSRLEVIEETVTASHVLLTELHDRWVVSHQEEKGAPNWTIPRPSPAFTGQETYLERLRGTLGGGSVTGITQPAGLSGFGGIGKTELALAYAQVFGQDYCAGYFIVADSTPALDFGLAKIGVPGLLEDADDTTIQSARHEALQQLASRDKLLLILDNVDEIVQTDALNKVFLALPKAHFILTCRHRDLGSNAVLVEVDQLDEATGALYVLREGVGNEVQGLWAWEEFPESEREGALALSRELDGLPLALHHAGCAMRGESLTTHEVLKSYRANRKRMLANRGNVGTGTHPDSVVVTVKLALEKLQKKDAAAAELVICCAFLDPTGMFEMLFTEKLIGMESVLADNLSRFDEVRRGALASGLVQRIAAEKRLVMHRLTQAVILDLPSVKAETRLGNISSRATVALREKGQYLLELAQAEFSLEETKSVLGVRHADTMTSMGNLAGTYSSMGRYRDALTLQKEVLSLRKSVLGDHHPDTLTSMNNLASTYRSLGRYRDALTLQQEALSLRKSVLGDHHPDTLVSMDNLASTYWFAGRYEDALTLQEQVLSLRKSILGDHHPDTLTSMNNLASTYRSLGRHGNALTLQQEALSLRKSVLGDHHPDTLTSMNNLASTYGAIGRHGNALSLREEVLSLRKSVLGDHHPATLTSMNNLAGTYFSLGRLEDSAALVQACLKARESVLGFEHPDTIQTRANLEIVLAAIAGRLDNS